MLSSYNLGKDEGHREEFHRGICLGLILGDDHVAERALKSSESGLARMPKLEGIFEVLCKEYEVDISVLYEQSQLQNSGWMSGNPTLSPFSGWNEMHGGSMDRNSSSEMGQRGEAGRRSRVLQLAQQGENYRHSEFRAMAAFVVQSIEGLTLTSLASELGRDLSALSQSAGRLHKQMKEDPALRERVNKVMSLILVS